MAAIALCVGHAATAKSHQADGMNVRKVRKVPHGRSRSAALVLAADGA